MRKCPDCNSERIIKNAKALDRTDYSADAGFNVAVDENPAAWILKQTVYSTVKLNICADCGFISFYADNPQTLWNAYQNQGKNVS
jgi:hypothetical protein